MKTQLIFTLAGALFTIFGCSVFAGTYSGGTGAPNAPYRIATAQDLNDIGNHPEDFDKYFVLVNDINLAPYTNTQFRIIGSSSSPFTGVFDGNRKRILNFTFTHSSSPYYGDVGIFGFVNSGGLIKDLKLINPNVKEGSGYYDSGGALVGVLANDANILRCGVEGGTVSGGSYGFRVGGLAGSIAYGATVSNCYSTASIITGNGSYLGGLVGQSEYGRIVCSYSTGSVSGYSYVGGLVGYNIGVGDNRGAILNCYARGAVSASMADAGGLIGRYLGGKITNCYSTGLVSGGSLYIGGLVGEGAPGGLLTSFWDVNSSGRANSAGGTGKTTAEMKTLSTFTSAGWDFTNETANGTDDFWWLYVNGVDYPRLNWGKYSGGKGNANDPYQIATKADLLTLAADTNDYDKCFVLTADVNMEGQVFTTAIIAPDTVAGNASFDGIAFTGTFDGNDHKIINYNINGGSNRWLGLFGSISSGSLVKNLGVEDFTVSGLDSWIVGGLVGDNMGSISNCYSTGEVACGDNSGNLGGLVGISRGGISNCYSTGTVSGGDYSGLIGALAGTNCGNMRNCYSTSLVTGSYNSQNLGGLVGMNSYYGSIYHGSISDCYSTGSVSGTSYVGGLLGYNSSGSVNNSFWDTQTSSRTTSEGGTGKTTTEMKMLSTFTSAGWDFADAWGIGNGQTYPYLKPFNGINSADLNYSGTVDFEDFAIFAANWLSGE